MRLPGWEYQVQKCELGYQKLGNAIIISHHCNIETYVRTWGQWFRDHKVWKRWSGVAKSNHWKSLSQLKGCVWKERHGCMDTGLETTKWERCYQELRNPITNITGQFCNQEGFWRYTCTARVLFFTDHRVWKSWPGVEKADCKPLLQCQRHMSWRTLQGH